MSYYVYGGGVYSEDELMHHGILGMKWGVRRFQNKDGSLKPAGEKRYNDGEAKKIVKRLNKNDEKIVSLKYKRESLKRINSENKQLLDAAQKAHQEAEKSGNTLNRVFYKHKAKLAQNAFDSSHKKLLSNQKRILDGEDKAKQLLSDANIAGYKIDSSKVDRLANRGKETAMTTFSVLYNKTPMDVVLYQHDIDAVREYRKGTAYRVRGSKRKLDDRQKQEKINQIINATGSISDAHHRLRNTADALKYIHGYYQTYY